MGKCNNEFEELLLEAWELCSDDERLRSLPVYCRLRKWLAKLTSNGERNNDEERARLKRVVCAIKDCNGDVEGELPNECEEECDDELQEECDDESCDDYQPECVKRRPKAPPEVIKKKDESVRCKLICALDAVNEHEIGMQQFFRDVARHTCDRGTMLMRVTGNVLSDFRSFVDNVFSNRVTQIGMVLAREQITLRDRFAELEIRTMNRAQLLLMFIKAEMPSFDWQRFGEKGYLKSIVSSICKHVPPEVDPDIDDVKGKGMLYQLNWLRSEIDRAECESNGLYEQFGALTTELAGVNEKISEIQCKMASDTAKLAEEIDTLQIKSAEQVCVIDKLMENIQITIQNKKTDANAENCTVKRI